MPPGRTLLAFAPLVLLVVGLTVYCLVDLARATSVRYLPKPGWALVIILISFPLGAIAYLVWGKDRRAHEDPLPQDHAGRPSGSSRSPRPSG